MTRYTKKKKQKQVRRQYKTDYLPIRPPSVGTTGLEDAPESPMIIELITEGPALTL
jgi:hypothetical protein